MQAHALLTPRTARYFTRGGPDPDAGPPSITEVWMALHGYGQPAALFLGPFEAIEAPGRLIVAPEALSRFYTDEAHRRVGASWMTREDREAEIADYVRYLDGVFEDACSRVAADPSAARLVVLGFSQGAATAARWLALSPLLAKRRPRAARLVLWGADLPHDLDLEGAHSWLTDADLTFIVGDADTYATPERVAAIEGRLDDAGIPYRLVRYAGGHRIERTVLTTLADG